MDGEEVDSRKSEGKERRVRSEIVLGQIGLGKAESKPAPSEGGGCGTQLPSGLAAVDGGVADVLALDDVDDVFGDVGGVVADAFEVFGDEDEFEGGEDDAGIA